MILKVITWKRSKQIAAQRDADVCLYFKSRWVVRCAAYFSRYFIKNGTKCAVITSNIIEYYIWTCGTALFS